VPTPLTLTPVGGATGSSTFTATWYDPSGNAINISIAEIAFSTPPTNEYETTVNGCEVHYYPPANNSDPSKVGNGTLYLLKADGSAQFADSSAIGPSQGHTLSNGACLVDAAS
jgi:hypothetical protein